MVLVHKKGIQLSEYRYYFKVVNVLNNYIRKAITKKSFSKVQTKK